MSSSRDLPVYFSEQWHVAGLPPQLDAQQSWQHVQETVGDKMVGLLVLKRQQGETPVAQVCVLTPRFLYEFVFQAGVRRWDITRLANWTWLEFKQSTNLTADEAWAEIRGAAEALRYEARAVGPSVRFAEEFARVFRNVLSN